MVFAVRSYNIMMSCSLTLDSLDCIVTVKAMVSSDLQKLCGKERATGNGEETNEVDRLMK